MRTMLFITTAAFALAACSDGGADADKDGTITGEEMAAEASSGESIRMRAGEWENTIEVTEFDIPGVPENMKDMIAGQMGQSITSTSCITAEEADQPDASFFGGERNDDCKYEEFDRTANKLTLRMTCATGDGGTAKVAMDGEFGEDSFTLSMDNTVSGTPGGDVTMKGTVSGRRIGDCPG
ncbi:DUF3617 domain-containing protein [Alteriqipengyuania lutimaris]|uniref:DUF3617 domain-containing protein n=1 Tax=Alteriqipengyuania lutimaris TaxID=1538146 RepID=A0A395LJI0_9SPHN|nr:DUF3617 domain-containing protein [Alteriqipengyuania lutimaris]MBB3033905.1 hypothetical protein [Alteriqipengyuania lutimaris]RDS77133.1 DUF3617 domain-containing protein [Alteriqipengyuania lutimaris]